MLQPQCQGYALLYKGMGRSVNAIPLEELTVSLTRYLYRKSRSDL